MGRGREVGGKGEGNGNGVPPCPPPHRGSPTPPGKNHKLLYVSLEILVRSSLEPKGLIAFRIKSMRPSVKYVNA